MKKLITTLSILLIATAGLLCATNVYAIDTNYYYEIKQCEALLKEAKFCLNDSDCEVINNSKCHWCVCYTAVNKQADLSKIDELFKQIKQLEIYDGMICETCNPEPPIAVCEDNICVEKYVESKIESKTYTVERVIDGDTIKLTNGEEVQLIGVKAPDDEKMGQEATEFVEWVFNNVKKVELELDVQERDKYGRLLAYVFLSQISIDVNGPTNVPPVSYLDGIETINVDDKILLFVNATIIKAGYATPMTIPPNVKYADLFKELYEEAREKGRGLWREDYSCKQDSDCHIVTDYVPPEGERPGKKLISCEHKNKTFWEEESLEEYNEYTQSKCKCVNDQCGLVD